MAKFDVTHGSDGFELTIGETAVRFPYHVADHVSKRGVLVVLLHSENTSRLDDPDIHIDSDGRNVIGIDKSGEKVWTIALPPHDYDGDETYNNYKTMYQVTGRLLAHHRNEHLYQIDPETGDIVNSWPENQLPIGDKTVNLDGDLDQVLRIGDRIFVNVSGLHWSEGDTYAFTPDGSRLWRSERSLKTVYEEDGSLWSVEPAGGRMWEKYPVDMETGERGEGEIFEGYQN